MIIKIDMAIKTTLFFLKLDDYQDYHDFFSKKKFDIK